MQKCLQTQSCFENELRKVLLVSLHIAAGHHVQADHHHQGLPAVGEDEGPGGAGVEEEQANKGTEEAVGHDLVRPQAPVDLPLSRSRALEPALRRHDDAVQGRPGARRVGRRLRRRDGEPPVHSGGEQPGAGDVAGELQTEHAQFQERALEQEQQTDVPEVECFLGGQILEGCKWKD